MGVGYTVHNRVAAGVQRALDSSNVAFCFIGGVPLQRWGETRYKRVEEPAGTNIRAPDREVGPRKVKAIEG